MPLRDKVKLAPDTSPKRSAILSVRVKLGLTATGLPFSVKVSALPTSIVIDLVSTKIICDSRSGWVKSAPLAAVPPESLTPDNVNERVAKSELFCTLVYVMVFKNSLAACAVQLPVNSIANSPLSSVIL